MRRAGRSRDLPREALRKPAAAAVPAPRGVKEGGRGPGRPLRHPATGLSAPADRAAGSAPYPSAQRAALIPEPWGCAGRERRGWRPSRRWAGGGGGRDRSVRPVPPIPVPISAVVLKARAPASRLHVGAAAQEGRGEEGKCPLPWLYSLPPAGRAPCCPPAA